MLDQSAKNAAVARFMQMLQARDANDPLPAIEAADLFPMIGDDMDAQRSTLLQQSIDVEIDEGSDLPRLTLRHNIIITKDGKIVDGRNRVTAILAKFGAPKGHWGEIVEGGADDMAVAMRGDRFRAEAIGSDWLARHVEVVDKHEDELFEDVIAHNMARRDLTSSQRAAVAAQITSASAQKTKGTKFNVATGAQAFGVSEKSVKRARFVMKHAPEMFREVLEGRESVGNAEARVQAMQSKNSKVPSSGTKKDAVEVEGPEAKIVKAKVSITMEAVAEAIQKADDVKALFNAIIDGLDARDGEHAVTERDLDAVSTALARALKVNVVKD